MLNRTLIAALLVACFAAAPALAQTKIGVVSPGRILKEMKETKDIETALKTEQEALQTELQARQAKLKAVEDQKNQLKPDAPQWAELNKQAVSLRAELEAWARNANQELGRKMHTQSRAIYQKVKVAVEEVAKSKGLDLVITEGVEPTEEDLMRIPPQQLLQALFSRNVFYAADQLDITQEVIVKLDAAYTPAK